VQFIGGLYGSARIDGGGSMDENKKGFTGAYFTPKKVEKKSPFIGPLIISVASTDFASNPSKFEFGTESQRNF